MKREELQHDFHNEQGINWLNSQGEPDIDYVMWLENKILAIKNNTPLPPAEGVELDHSHDHPLDHLEGAEEILTNHLGNLMPLKYGVKYNKTIDAMREFATLHARKMAEEMVKEKCKKCKYRGLPDSIQEALNSGDGIYRP